ncbi:MAG: ATP-binding protein [Clostridia bacterium]|nr:ATP-binding protein [Clostridia bacterium]
MPNIQIPTNDEVMKFLEKYVLAQPGHTVKLANISGILNKESDFGPDTYANVIGKSGMKLKNWLESNICEGERILYPLWLDSYSLYAVPRSSKRVYSVDEFILICKILLKIKPAGVYFLDDKGISILLRAVFSIQNYKEQITGGKELSEWINDNIGELKAELSITKNGYIKPKVATPIQPAKQSDTTTVSSITEEEFLSAVNEILEKKIKIYFANFDNVLKECRPDLANYRSTITGGAGFESWVKKHYPNYFYCPEDGHYFTLPGTVPTLYPEAPHFSTMVQHTTLTNHIETLQKYTGDTKTKLNWAGDISLGFSDALLGLNDIVCYSVDGINKIVFDTGIKTLNDNPILCVIAENTIAENDTHQYVLDGFCAIAEDTGALCDEIRKWAPTICISSSDRDATISQLRSVFDMLSSVSESLTHAIESIKTSIEKGLDLDAAAYANLKAYHDKWEQAKKLVYELDSDCDESAISLEYMSNLLSTTDGNNSVFIDTQDLFCDFLQTLKAYFKSAGAIAFVNIIENHINTVNGCTSDSCEVFRALVMQYKNLMQLTDMEKGPSEDAETGALFNSLNTCFAYSLYPPEAFYNKTAEDMGLEDKFVPTKVELNIASIERANNSVHDDSEVKTIGADELFEIVIDGTTSDEIFNVLPLIHTFCPTPLEKAIAKGDFATCKKLIEKENPEDERLSLIDTLEKEEGTPDHSLFHCGRRIYSLLSNEKRVAEKHFVAGLMFDSLNCANELFHIYATEKKHDFFYRLFERYGEQMNFTDIDDLIFLLEVLCTKGEDALNTYLRRNVAVLYHPICASALNSLCEQFDCDETAKMLSLINKNYNPASHTTELENMLLDAKSIADFTEIGEYIKANREELENAGYATDDLHAQITNNAELRLCTPLVRLHVIQKNKNGTVERLIWESLFNKRNLALCGNLLSILSEESRFYELRLLYRCYEDKLSLNTNSRELYIRSMFKNPDGDMCELVHANMQDVFNLYATGRITLEDLHTAGRFAASIGNDHELFTLLPKFAEYVGDPLLKSIILVSDRLRDYAMDTSLIENFDLTTEQLDNFVFAYRSSLFDMGRNVLSIGKRLFTFIGCKNGLAKEFILLALHCGYNAFEALWKLYSAEGDKDALLNLFTLFPEQKENKKSEYVQLLFEKGDYEAYLDTSDSAEESSLSAVYTVIAKCNLKREISIDDILSIAENSQNIALPQLALMQCSLAKCGYYPELAAFISAHFDGLFATYSASEIEGIITANGALSHDDLKQVAKHTENPALKFYLFERMGIGRAKVASAEYFRELLSLYADAVGEEKSALATKIKSIYANNDTLITDFILLSVKDALESEESSTDAVAEILNDVSLTKDGVRNLLEILKDNNITLTAKLSESVIEMCITAGVENECTALIGSVFSIHPDNAGIGLSNTLCTLYTAALENSTFDDEWTEYARTLCNKLSDTEFAHNAMYLAYSLAKHSGNSHQTNFALFMLNKHKFTLPENVAQKIEAIYNESELSGRTNIPDLFTAMLHDTDTSGIMDYCRFCGIFVKDFVSLSDTFVKILETNPDIYSLEETAVLLQLLYRTPDDTALWRYVLKTPIDNASSEFAKLMYCACLIIRDNKLWQKCLNICEQCCETLFASALISFVQNAHDPSMLRTFLAQKINTNPAYLAQLGGEDSITLTTLLCEQLDDFTVQNHGAIRDLSSIVIATDSKDAFEIMNTRLAVSRSFDSAPTLPFAIACNLLLRKRFAEAKDAIASAEKLSTINSFVKYKKLIANLAAMDEADLSEWSAIPLNQHLLTMILPDGNYPKIEVLQHFVFSSNFETREKADLLCTLLDNKPDDYACLSMLFQLCVQLPGEINMLHRALCGLVRHPQGNAASFYSRSRKDYALLLVILNAYILQNGLDREVSAFDGYDFASSTSEFYGKRLRGRETLDPEDSANFEDEIRREEENITRLLSNRTPAELEILHESILCYVTGNWCDFFISCYTKNIALTGYILNFPNIKNGFARNVLKAIYTVDENDREEFCTWVHDKVMKELPSGSFVMRQTKAALALHEQGHFAKIPRDVLDSNILELPFEEASLCNNIIKMTVEQLEIKAPSAVYDASCLAIALSRSESVARELRKKADEAFRASNDALAYSYYCAIHEYCAKAGLPHFPSANYQFDQKQDSKIVSKKNKEDLQAHMRITGAFSGNSGVLSKISAANFNSWSCVNIVFALLYSTRANEVNRLINLLSPKNQRLALAIMTIIDARVSDQDKVETILTFKDDIGRAFLCYAMTKTNGQSLAFLKDEANLAQLVAEYNKIAKSTFVDGVSKLFSVTDKGVYNPEHWLTIEPFRIKMDLAMAQLDPTSVKLHDSSVSETGRTSSGAKLELSFVSGLTPIEGEDNVDLLWQEHEGISYYSIDDCRSKYELSGRIYRLISGRGAASDELYDYALRFGVDAYYLHLMSREYADAYNIILEMMDTYDSGNNSVGNRKLAEISTNALHSLFTRGFNSLGDLVRLFIKHYDAFHTMKMLLPTTTNDDFKSIDAVYSALDTIAAYLKTNSATNAAIYEAVLRDAQKLLSESTVSYSGWGEVNSSLNQKIQAEINAIDNRPKLAIAIENTSSNIASVSIFGCIENTGKAAAENIKIQILSDDASLPNDEYYLPRLDAGDVATFNPCFEPDGKTTGFDYFIDVTYEHNGEIHSTRFDGYRLNIDCEPYVFADPIDYSLTGSIVDFSLNEKGEVFSPTFFGREYETMDIRALFSDRGFLYYQNALMIGMRRVGKSSLLNYLKAYANFKFDDVIPVWYECGGDDQANQPVQIAFVKRVLDACLPLTLQGANLNEIDRDALSDELRHWVDFYMKWDIPSTAPDRDPYTLKFFYRELKELNGGKGLMLILDEFDTVITALETEQHKTASSGLFPALREILNDADCRHAVHFVICGSTELMRHFDSGTLSQFFQQLATNTIEVGNLPYKDMEKMITTPCDHTPYSFTKSAIDRIWKYTNGLAWYAKLVAQAAIDFAREDCRYTVYAEDVVFAISKVAPRETNYKAINHSCREELELPLLKKIRCITTKASEYVSLDNLVERFGDKYSRSQIERAVNTLISFKILVRHPHKPNLYRFAVELYWHFFGAQESDEAKLPPIPESFAYVEK